MSTNALPAYESTGVTQFLQLLQEATRPTPDGGPSVYVPPSGGEIAEANYHHFVFGQRGSGKSSLLRHLQQGAHSDGRGVVWIDQEIFSNLSYPDVLVSAVHELMKGLAKNVKEQVQPDTDSLWTRIVLLIRRDRRDPGLFARLSESIAQLERIKLAPLDQKIQMTVEAGDSSKTSGSAGLKIKVLTTQADIESARTRHTTTVQTFESTKEQYLERALIEFRDLIKETAKELGGGFVFVDDLYQLKRSTQPQVLGYLHRLTKDTGFWLKIGSIRYSTVPFKPGDPPRGMQIGHDAQEVALDQGLRHFKSTQQFLETILKSIAKKVDVDIDGLLTDDARRRLVLAAGGVARDYLRLVSGSITEARNRGPSAKAGSHRVIVEDVNRAAGALSPSKLDDLRKDEPLEAKQLEALVRDLTEFCRSTKAAYFLVASDQTELSDQINKLQHLRFTHLLFESETIPDRRSQRFNGWLLDVAELSAQRATQGMDFLGWENREKRRNRKLIYSRTSSGKQGEATSVKLKSPWKAEVESAQGELDFGP